MITETKNSRTIGAILICAAATLWGLDGVVLTPRLYNLDISRYRICCFYALPFSLLSIFLFKNINI